ncbi:protoporphyrinogen/coproporphyrinogen oxidase [Polyangium aurulentum]|uniref:protoporphyrinogen/coproporphyrinogen oxidase n=1 Tax=Polyangium aurulentum TaxID=2567896 RepID=UPI0010AE4B2B|nr:FAD-dependent oxidoreductase [Polyangium aurulentum]UQA61086.1 FAD-dependent oxidoreductase [Polyangium aurulentum]
MIHAPRTPVAILGAGLTGMSASHHLGRAGAPHRLFERLEQPGGHAITLEDEGYRFDRTGHLLHLRDPELRALALGWIGDDWIEIDRRSRIWSHGTYTRYPFQANTFGLPPAVAYECLHGFIQAHFAKDKPAPRNFEEFCLQHFGEGISRHFMIPYNTRLWGVSPREITPDWCSRFVPMPKLEDVLAGAVGLNDRELGYNARFVYPRLGIGRLAEGMAAALPERLELGRAPRAIDWKKRELHFEDEVVPYDVLVSTLPLPALVRTLVDPPPAVLEAARRLRCTHLYYLDVALEGPCGEPLHWVYVPEEKYPFYRVGCYSNFSEAMAPPGKANLYVELADRAEPNLPELLPRVAEGLVEMGLIDSPRAIRFARVRRIDHAYVVFDHDYFPSLEAIVPFLEANRIVTAGRYGGWNYSSMEDALRFGREAAAKAGALLGSAR